MHLRVLKDWVWLTIANDAPAWVVAMGVINPLPVVHLRCGWQDVKIQLLSNCCIYL